MTLPGLHDNRWFTDPTVYLACLLVFSALAVVQLWLFIWFRPYPAVQRMFEHRGPYLIFLLGVAWLVLFALRLYPFTFLTVTLMAEVWTVPLLISVAHSLRE